MEEKNMDSKNIKEEATDAVNQVKDTIKNVDIKKDSLETKGFIVEMFKNPLEKIREIATKNDKKFLKYVIIILVIWCISELVHEIFTLNIWGYFNLGKNILRVIIAGITPIISILVMSIIVFLVKGKNKKNLTTIISTITSANIPMVIASIVSLLTLINIRANVLTNPFAQLCNVITIILSYFGIKSLLGIEKNSEYIKKFVIIEAIFYIVYIVLSFLEIYI